MDADMYTVQEAGMKVVLRFAYTSNSSADAKNSSVIYRHLGQLKPWFEKHAHVIAIVQAGLIGTWGEWLYSDFFGWDEASLQQRANVVAKLLQVVPPELQVQLRTPMYKRTLLELLPGAPCEFGVCGVQDVRAVAAARLGHHNDCFLASETDFGTFETDADRRYLEIDTASVAMGGETCNLFPERTNCGFALEELARYHWSYLNQMYHPGVWEAWQRDGCDGEVKRRLGYRLSLRSVVLPRHLRPFDPLRAEFVLENFGFAAPFNRRDFVLVLHRIGIEATSSPVELNVTFGESQGPASWLPGRHINVSAELDLPSGIRSGLYEVMLRLPDPSPALRNRPEYAIRLANVEEVDGFRWEPLSGANSLGHAVLISSGHDLIWGVRPAQIRQGEAATIVLYRPQDLCCSDDDWVGIYQQGNYTRLGYTRLTGASHVTSIRLSDIVPPGSLEDGMYEFAYSTPADGGVLHRLPEVVLIQQTPGLNLTISSPMITPDEPVQIAMYRPWKQCCSPWDWIGLYKQGSWDRISYAHSHDGETGSVSWALDSLADPASLDEGVYEFRYSTDKDGWVVHSFPEQTLRVVKSAPAARVWPASIERGGSVSIMLSRPPAQCCAKWDWVGIYAQGSAERLGYIHTNNAATPTVTLSLDQLIDDLGLGEGVYEFKYSTAVDGWVMHNLEGQRLRIKSSAARALYVDRFDETLLQVGGSGEALSTSAAALLEYARANSFTTLLLYDLHKVLRSEANYDVLAFFIKRARAQGVKKVGALGEVASWFQQAPRRYMRSRTDPEQQFDIYNLEFEYWTPSAEPGGYYCETYLRPRGDECSRAGGFHFFNEQLGLLRAEAADLGMGIEVETYLGWPASSDECAGIAAQADTVRLHAYVADPSAAHGYLAGRVDCFANKESPGGSPLPNISVIFSGEDGFMGPWLGQHGLHAAEKQLISDITEGDRAKVRFMTESFTYFASSHLQARGVVADGAA